MAGFLYLKLEEKMMIFKNVDKEYVEEALQIAMEEYKAECLKCPGLIKRMFEEELRGLLEALFDSHLGKVALENEKVIGYLAFWGPIEGFFGNVKGAFSPLGGNGFRGNHRSKLASKLFQAVSEELVEKGICSYALSHYAHDEEVGKSFFMNGFGIRCSDAIMKLSNRKIPKEYDASIACVELKGAEKQEIKDLKRGLTKHLASSPTFFPTDLASYMERVEDESIRVIAAKKQDKVIGFMKLSTGAETFITGSKDMYNICGAFVEEEYRGKHVAQQLLEYVCQIAEEAGKTYLGVDCETLNPTALRFWGKYFTSYTYSYHRRVDERVVGYKAYMEDYFNK